MKAGTARSGRTILAVIAAISMIMSLMAVYAMPAEADHEDTWPATPQSNQASFWETWGANNEGEDDWSCSKTDNDDDVPGAYELGDPPSGESWRLLVVKAGNDHNDLYWDPTPGEEYAATGQGAGGWSHVILCSRPLPEPGEIIVEKEVTDGDTSQSFDFAASYDGDGFSLADGDDNESGDLGADTYTVTESVPTGWTLDDVVCVAEGDSTTTDITDGVDIDLAAGDTVTCTFSNSEDPPPPPEPGEIVVVKAVTEGSDTDQSFDFTADYDADGFSLANGESNNSGELDAGNYAVSETVPTGWTLDSATCDNGDTPDSIDLGEGQTVTCTFTNDEDPPPPPPEPGEIVVVKAVTEGSDTDQSFDFTADYDADGFSLANGESNNSGDLDAGNYAVSETVPTGWTLDSATCDDGSSPSNIDLAAGETVTCTFVNDETPPPPPPEAGEIIVQKFVDDLEDDPQGFAFTFNTTGFTLGDNTLAHGESSSSGDLEAGNYSVSEEQLPEWRQVSATCDGGNTPESIDLEAGETVTCTFVNTIESEVQASIVVTVDGSCEVDGDEGEGVIDVEISVDDGADVVISDSDGDVIETLSSSGTVTVPEGATYTWEATPNEGFEFPAGSDTSGSITIETCSDDPETLPFTGLDTGMMSLFASALLGGGLLLVTAMRRQEEA